MKNLSQSNERFYSLQVIRGLAAVSVLLFHVERYTKSLGGETVSIFNYVPFVFGQGAFWFFEISGFIMAYLIDRRTNRNFLLQRVIRIYPPYFLAVITAIVLQVMLLGFYSVSRLDLAKALTLLPMGQITYILRVEWSLKYEIFFYLVCTIWAIGYFKNFYPYFLAAWFMIIIGVQFQQSHLLLHINEIFLSQFNLYFIMGGFVYYINKRKKVKNKYVNFIIMTVSLMSYILLFYFRTHPFLSSDTLLGLLMSTAFAVFIYSFLQLETSQTNILVKFGDYSYGIYLIHVTTIIVSLELWKQFMGEIGTLAGFFAFGVSLTFGWLFGNLDVTLHRWIKSQPGIRQVI